MTTCACTDPGTVWGGTPTGSKVSLAGLVPTIDAIPIKALETVREWLASVDIKCYESKINLNWKPILKKHARTRRARRARAPIARPRPRGPIPARPAPRTTAPAPGAAFQRPRLPRVEPHTRATGPRRPRASRREGHRPAAAASSSGAKRSRAACTPALPRPPASSATTSRTSPASSHSPSSAHRPACGLRAGWTGRTAAGVPHLRATPTTPAPPPRDRGLDGS